MAEPSIKEENEVVDDGIDIGISRLTDEKIQKTISSIQCGWHCGIDVSGACQMPHRALLIMSATNGFVLPHHYWFNQNLAAIAIIHR